MTWLLLAASVACALVAGIFFGFSTFVMGALGRLESAAGVAAMQSINVVVLNSWFLGAFFGAGGLAVAAAAWSFRLGPAAGALLYLVGCVGVTGACNVPLNDQLAAQAPNASGAERVWTHYQSSWTRWNHVRTAASLAAAVLLAAGARP